MRDNANTTATLFLVFSMFWCALAVSCSSGVGGGSNPAAEAEVPEDDTPPDETDGESNPPPDTGGEFSFVLGTDFYAPSDTARPAKGQAITDPNFHTQLLRVTDKDADGYSGAGIQNEYAKCDPENCAGTLLILRGNDAAYYLYDPSTYEPIRQLTVFNTCGQEPEPRWDPVDPLVFYYVCNTELRSYNVDTDVSATVHDFAPDFPDAAYVLTKAEGDASLDRRYWAFLVEDSSWNLLAVAVYDRTADAVVGQKSSDFREGLDWVGMSMSGQWCALGWDAYVAPLTTTIVSRDFSQVTELPDGSTGHGDFALTAEGRDVYVYQNTRTDYLAMADLETGAETPLVPIPFDVNPDIGLHVSGNADQTPGWVLISTYGSQNPPPDSSHSWLDTQLLMVELKANPRIWRIAHTHSYTSLDYLDEKNYFAEAFATINSTGTRIYFGSNWGDLSVLDYTDTYLVTLPEDWIQTLPD